jgi:hypothetical protein
MSGLGPLQLPARWCRSFPDSKGRVEKGPRLPALVKRREERAMGPGKGKRKNWGLELPSFKASTAICLFTEFLLLSYYFLPPSLIYIHPI